MAVPIQHSFSNKTKTACTGVLVCGMYRHSINTYIYKTNKATQFIIYIILIAHSKIFINCMQLDSSTFQNSSSSYLYEKFYSLNVSQTLIC